MRSAFFLLILICLGVCTESVIYAYLVAFPCPQNKKGDPAAGLKNFLNMQKDIFVIK